MSERTAEVLVKAQVKPDQPWQEYPTRTLAGLRDRLPARNVPKGRYGGRADRRAPAKGFFYPLKIGNRWWVIDPDGHPCIHIGVTGVRRGNTQTSEAALAAKFGDEKRWANETATFLLEHGFAGAGSWSDIQLLREAEPRVTYAPIWNFMSSYGKVRGGIYQASGHTGYRNGCIFVFEPEFEDFCNEHAKRLAEAQDDPYLFGHFSDNELPSFHDLLDRFLSLETHDPGYQAAREWFAQRTGRWPENTDITDEDRDAFRGYVFEEYARITTQAIKRYDPNHMALGPRLHGSAKDSPAIFAGVGKYLDVIAVNFYGAWVPPLDQLRAWTEWSGRPTMITEFYTKGADSGYPNTSGAGWIVETQADRGKFYQAFTLQLLESRTSVGWHWFKYMDNDPDDLTTDPSNRDSNKGMVTIRYEPYEELVSAMKELNDAVYACVDYFDGVER